MRAICRSAATALTAAHQKATMVTRPLSGIARAAPSSAARVTFSSDYTCSGQGRQLQSLGSSVRPIWQCQPQVIVSVIVHRSMP